MSESAESELFEQLFSSAAQGICDELAADCARSETGTCGHDSDGGSIGPSSSSESPSQHRRTTCWWAPLLKEHVQEHAWDPLNMKPISLVSACAGSCAEAEVLRVSWWLLRGHQYMTYMTLTVGCNSVY